MRLIDAEQCPCYICGATCPYTNPIGDCRKFNNWIRKPAYDVDKVLEELNKEYELWLRGYNQTLSMGMEHLWRNLSGRAYGVSEAIEIVKRGGGINE